VGINYGNVGDLPEFSSGPHGSPDVLHHAVAEAGYEGLQGGDAELCARYGLTLLGSGLVTTPEEAAPLAADWKERGASIVTCIVGFGFESDREIDTLAAALCQASADHNIAVLLETHRASITQDAWRTVQLAGRFPELCFNLDLSHWFTGQEMPYGDFDKRIALLEPILSRTRFLHGRIGDRCCMQVALDSSADPTISLFRRVWKRAMLGFLNSKGPEQDLWFCPELLGTTYSYARQFRDPNGTLREETDRWQQAQLLAEIARDCFNEATG
jgi:hypothetical protein